MKGEFSIGSLLGVIVVLVLFGALYPTINDLIDAMTPTMDTTTAGLLDLLPLFIVVAIIIGVVMSAINVNPTNPYGR